MEVNLVMFKPNGSRKNFPLLGSSTVVGRAEDCGLRIPLLSVSRRHCEIAVMGGKLTVKDLASSNGTYVNNQRVNEAELSPGDRLVIGPVVFTIQIDGKPEGVQQVKTRGQKLAEGSHAGAESPLDIDAEIAAELGNELEDSGLDEVVLGEDTSVGPAESGDTDQADPMSALEISDEDGDDGKSKKRG